MKYPQDFIDRVRESSNVVDIIGQYVELRRTGGNYQGLCPFHNEKTPSFSVSEDKQVYHCFGCKKSGNVFSFVQDYQGLTFPEAIEYLAKRASLPLPKLEGEQAAKKDSKEPLYRVNALAAQFFHQQLKNLPPKHEVWSYLGSRGLTSEIVDTYKLGYAPDAWSELENDFAAKKVPVTLAAELGLLKARGGGKSGHYDLFRHRIMFPIFSPTRQCLGFGGRVLSSDQQPKYLNSPDSPIFHKGKVFYGLETSVKYIRAADEMIIVEGYMDWLALAKVGILNIAATLGTALTVDHARSIKRYTQKVLLLFDGDEAGKNAAKRSLPILLAEGLHARGLFLPDQLDPDEFIQERGVEKLKAAIENAPDLFELVAHEMWLESKSSPSGKVELLDQLLPILRRIPDERLLSLYVDRLAVMMDIDRGLIERGVNNERPIQNRPSRPAPRPRDPGKIDLSRIPRLEQELLNVILMKEVYLEEALKSGVFAEISHPGLKQVVTRIEEEYRLMPNKFDNLSALLAGEVEPADVVTRHLAEPYRSLNEENAAKLLQDCIKRVKENFLRHKSKELVSSLRGSNPVDSVEQLEQIMNIHRSRRSLNRDT